MSDLHIPSILLLKAHFNFSDVESIEWGPSTCEVRTCGGHQISVDRRIVESMIGVGGPVGTQDHHPSGQYWNAWGWQQDPKAVSKQIAAIAEMLRQLSNLESLPEDAKEQLAKAFLHCSDASYTVVGENPEADGLFSDARVAGEEACES